MPRKHSTDSLHNTTTWNTTHNTESTAVSNLKPELGVHRLFKGRGARGKQNSQRNEEEEEDDDDKNNNFPAK
jgi:hypothetical protein